MAIIAVPSAFVEVDANGKKGSAYTNAQGRATIPIQLTETEYNNISLLNATSSKSSYNRGESNLSTLPSYADAQRYGVEMTIRMQKITNTNQFYISPMYLEFESTGGTQAVTVTCPDDTWTIYETLGENGLPVSDIQIQKTSSTSFNVVCPSGINYIKRWIYVRWYSTVNGWQYRTCEIYRAAQGSTLSNIIFSATLIDSETLDPIANQGHGAASVIATTNTSDGFIDTYLGTAGTDINGYASITMQTTETQYNSWDTLRLAATPPQGYRNATVLLQNKPTFSSAVANGIFFGLIKVDSTSLIASEVKLSGRVLYSNGSPVVNAPIFLFASNSPSDTGLGFANAVTDSNGYYEYVHMFSPNDYGTPYDWLDIVKFGAAYFTNFPDIAGLVEITNKPSLNDARLNGLVFPNMIINI